MTEPERPEAVRGLATVGSDVAAVTAARAAGLAVGAVTVVLSTRLLGPAGYAELAYATVLAGLIFTVSSAWTAAAVTRYGREELEQRGTLRHTSWARLVLTLPLLVVGCLLVAGAAAAELLPPEMSWGLVGLAIASGVLLTASEHFVVVLEAAGRFRTSAVAVVLRSTLVACGLAAIWVATEEASPELVVSLTVAAGLLLTIWLAASLWRLSIWPVMVDRAVLRRMLLFSLPLMAFAASQYGMRSVDIVVLRAFEPSALVGVYAAALQAFLMLGQLTTTLTIVLIPLFVSLEQAGRGAELRRYADRLLPQMALLMGLAVSLAMPVAAMTIGPVLGEAYSEAAEPFAVLLLALLLKGIASLAAPVLILYERSKATAAINVGALGINLIGDVVLIGVLGAGLIGPAVACALAIAFIAVGYLIVAGRCLGARVGLPATVAIAPSVAVVATLALPAGWALVAAVATVAVAVATATATGLFSSADADLIERLPLPGAARRRLLSLLGAGGG